MKKILITGASTYGVKNHGDDAMFDVFCKGIRRELKNVEITFMGRHPDKSFDKEFEVQTIKNIDHDSKKQSLGRWFFGFNPGDPTHHLAEIRKRLEETDLVVIGGNSFMEVSQSDFLRGVSSYSATIATWARLFNKPFALYGAAVYPMKSDYTKQIARFLCNNASLVTLRENASKEELIDAGVKNEKNLKVLADPAFGLDIIQNKTPGLNVLKQNGISLTKPNLVGIAFRHMYWLWNEKDFEKYSLIIAKTVDFIIENFNADVLFIPNCTYSIDTKLEDDREIAKAIKQKVKNKKNAHIILKEHTLKETLSIYPLLSLLISNRRHSLIFAAIHNIPVFALSTGHIWHFKPWIKELELDDQLISMTESNATEIQNKITNTWNKREGISKILKRRIPKLRSKALQHTKYLADLIR